VRYLEHKHLLVQNILLRFQRNKNKKAPARLAVLPKTSARFAHGAE